MAIQWECPNCHHKVSEKRKKCTKCGTFRTKDVVWWIDVTYRKNGKRIRKRIGRDKQAAILLEAKLKEKKSEIEINRRLGKEVEEFKTDEPITLEEFWPRYFLWCKGKNKALFDKKARWENHVKKAFGNKLLSEITGEDIKKYQIKRLKEGASNSSINREVALVRHMLNMAVKWGYLKSNPILGKIEMLKENKDRWTYLMPDEVERIRKHLSPTYHALFDFLLFTGLRLGDALNLQWQDINFYTGFILIRGYKTKSGKPFGIPLNQKAREILEKKLAKAGKVDKEDRVFKHSDSEFRRAFKKALKLAGLPETIRIHDLRHTFASWLAMQGVPLQQIQALLGHSQISTTLRYAHLNPATLLPASEAAVKFAQNFLNRLSQPFSSINPSFETNQGRTWNEDFSMESNTIKSPFTNESPDGTIRH